MLSIIYIYFRVFMLQIFIQVLESSLSAAIVIGLVLGGCLRRLSFINSKAGRRLLTAAGVIGVVAALIISVLRRTTAWINLSFCSALGMVIALAAGICFICGIGSTGDNRVAGKRPKRLWLASGALLIAAVLFYTLPRAFLIPAGFLNAEESAASTDFLFKCAAYLAGMIFILLTGYGTAKTALLHDRGRTRALTTESGASPRKRGIDYVKIGCAATLAIELLNNAAQILQFMFARRIIPINRDVFLFVAFLRNNSNLFIFAELAALLLFAAALFVLAFFEKPVFGNPAEKRKARALFRGKGRRFALITVLACFSVFSLTALKVWTARTVSLSPPEPYLLENGEISIALDQVSDGRLHRFAWTASENVEVRFIVLKKNESSFGVGLDACDICGATGYYQRGDDVICMLCDVVMNKNTIGFKGGCNPVPLPYVISGGTMAVQCADLESERGRFK
ncbi:MAG: Fe-S-containing protein [Spirochaetaceae bacterium]|nr:Fe-S-containing protein [Spirochaetaceae bacterium]